MVMILDWNRKQRAQRHVGDEGEIPLAEQIRRPEDDERAMMSRRIIWIEPGGEEGEDTRHAETPGQRDPGRYQLRDPRMAFAEVLRVEGVQETSTIRERKIKK
jgi:hypothetical protein